MCSERTLVCSEDEFDSVPEFLVCSNGVFDLGVTEETRGGSMELLPHESVRRVTLRTRVEYRPEADCPMFKKYLREVLPDPEVRKFLQKALGSSLLGKPKDKKMINLIGPRNSGKSILLEVLRDALGDYCEWINPQVLTAKRNGTDPDKASPSLHATRLAKLVVASEPDSGDRWDAGLLKALTGRDMVHSRNMYGNLTKWTPRFLIVLASNDFVRLNVEDEALVARIAPVRFPKSYVLPEGDEGGVPVWPEGTPEDQRADKHLSERIRASEEEMSGVLNWLLEGLRMFLREGLNEPDAVREERGAMEKDSSLVVTWLEAAKEDGIIGELTLAEAALHGAAAGSVVPKKDRVTVREAWDDFCHWYEEEGYGEGGRGSGKPPIGKNTFSRVLGKKGSSEKKAVLLGGGKTGYDLLYWKTVARGRKSATAELTAAFMER
jgi:putative DNA primase/helicase